MDNSLWYVRKTNSDYIGNTKYTIGQVREMYGRGESLRSIAKKVGVCTTTVARHVDEKYREREKERAKKYAKKAREKAREAKRESKRESNSTPMFVNKTDSDAIANSVWTLGDIKQMYANGWPIHKIAKGTGISESVVRYHVDPEYHEKLLKSGNDHGRSNRPSKDSRNVGHSTYTRAEIKEMYANGYSVSDISRMTGIEQSSIRYHVTPRQCGNQSTGSKPKVPVAETVAVVSNEKKPALVKVVSRTVLIDGRISQYKLVDGKNVIITLKSHGHTISLSDMRDFAEEVSAAVSALEGAC